MPYKSVVFRDARRKKWVAEVHAVGSNRVTGAKTIWSGAYDSREKALKAARIKKAEAVKKKPPVWRGAFDSRGEAEKAAKAAREIRELAAEAKAERDKHGWKVNATKAIIEARHGRGRSC